MRKPTLNIGTKIKAADGTIYTVERLEMSFGMLQYRFLTGGILSHHNYERDDWEIINSTDKEEEAAENTPDSGDIEKTIQDITTRRGYNPGTKNNLCYHQFVTYTGLTEVFNYCKFCDIREEDLKEDSIFKLSRSWDW